MMQHLAQFHFIRPLWLLALVPCVLLALWAWRARARSGIWSELIDPALLGVLLLPESGTTRNRVPLLLLAGWSLAVLAMAGPSWERLPEPLTQRQDALIIALDLSMSMRARDIQPSRLDRVRYKLEDILANRHEGLTALIVYAGDAHVVTPLSDDSHTISAMLPALAPEIMPVGGSEPQAAVRAAVELLSGAGLDHGRLLVIADSWPEDTQAIDETLRRARLSLSLLAVGTTSGAPVPLADGGFLRNQDGGIAVAGVDLAAMQDAATSAGGLFSQLSIDDSDIRTLLPQTPFVDTDAMSSSRVFDQWQDRGPWLLLLLLPLVALAFRRGWLLAAVLMFAGALPSAPATALEWQDLWLRKDQQATRALQQQDPARAAQLFRAPDWRGSAQYQAGDYTGAAESFAAVEGADAAYNRGNALARAGKLEQALAAYDSALQTTPEMTDALANRKLIEDLLKQQQEQQQQEQKNQSDNEEDQDKQQNGDKGQSDPSRSQQGQQQQGNESQDKQSQQQGNDEAGRREQQQGKAEQEQQRKPDQSRPRPEEPANEGEKSPQRAVTEEGREAEGDSEQQQALEQWLRQVPDNPGDLLRRKFQYETLERRARSGQEE